MAATLKLLGPANGDIDLNDGRSTGLQEWSPRVARRSRSDFGPLFTDALEAVTMRITSNAATPAAAKAAALATLSSIADALEQAWRWENGEGVDAVRISYQPEGSALSAPLQAAVLGGDAAGAAEGLLQLPPRFNDDINAWEISPLVLPLARRGLWLGDEEDASSSAAANPTVLTATFGTAVSLALARIQLKWTSGGGSFTCPAGFLCLASAANRLVIVDKSGTSVIGDPLGGEVLRVTANTSAANTSDSLTASYDQGARHTAVYVKVQANNTGAQWYLRAAVQRDGQEEQGPLVVFKDDAGAGRQVVRLGSIAHGFPAETLKIYYYADQTSGSLTLDIDCILVQALDDDVARVIALQATDITTSGITAPAIHVDHAALTDPWPKCEVVDTAGSFAVGVGIGGRFDCIQRGTVLAACLFATDADGGKWSHWDSTPIQHTLTVFRRPAYTVPQ